jgi:hypothetical protein
VLAAAIIRVIALMMKAVSTSSETSVNFYQASRRNIPEDKSSSYTLPEEPEISPIDQLFINRPLQ